MSAFNAGLSGLQTAQRVMDAISHNVSNVETPGFKKLVEHNKELGPFPVISGVTTSFTKAGDFLLDNLVNDATSKKIAADIMDDAMKSLDTLPSNTLESSYSDMMDSTHLLLRTPTDPIAQENFNQKTVKFQASVDQYQGQLDSIKTDMQARIDVESDRVELLQNQLRDYARSGSGTPEDLDFIKMQLLQATGSIDAYRKVLSSVIPPVELAFKSAVDVVDTSMNVLSGQEIFKDGEAQRVTDFTTFDESQLPEWDSHWFNTELGRIKTAIGTGQQIADNSAALANANYDSVSAEYNDRVGVDLVEENVKMMKYQRMYEACATVIKTQDEMLGTLINMVAR